MTDLLSSIGNLATAVGVFVAVWQIRQQRLDNITTFEDSIAREYRELAACLPIEALLGEELREQDYRAHFARFYRYFDLSNEQAFLCDVGRIRPETWRFWRDGIESNLRRPAFRRAWNEICSRAKDDFSELRAIFPPEAVQPPVELPPNDPLARTAA